MECDLLVALRAHAELSVDYLPWISLLSTAQHREEQAVVVQCHASKAQVVFDLSSTHDVHEFRWSCLSLACAGSLRSAAVNIGSSQAKIGTFHSAEQRLSVLEPHTCDIVYR